MSNVVAKIGKGISKISNCKRTIVIFAIICFFIHLSSVHISPITWLDEIMIVEFGRTVCENVNVEQARAEHRVVLASGIHYLGSVVHYWANTLLGRGIGPRVLDLLCYCGCGVLLFYTSLSFTKSIRLSNFISLIWLCEPLVLQSVRGARVDILAFVLFFGAVLMLQRAFHDEVKGSIWRKHYQLYLLLSFLFIGCCAFIWMTSVVLVCFYFTLLCYLLINQKAEYAICRDIILEGLGCAVIICCLFLLFMPGHLIVAWRATFSGTSSAVGNNSSLFKTIGSVLRYGGFNLLYLGWFALLILLVKDWRNWLFPSLFVCLGFLVVCISSPYVHRVIYLCPGYAILFGLGVKAIKENHLLSNAYCRIVIKVFATCYVFFFFSYSVAGRGINAWKQYEARRSDWLYEQFDKLQELRNEGAKIYCPYEALYYISLENRWQLYSDVEKCNYLVLRLGDEESQISREDFQVIATISHPKGMKSLYGKYVVKAKEPKIK